MISVEDFKDSLARLDASTSSRGGSSDGGSSVRSAEVFTMQCAHVGNIGRCTGVAATDERALVRRYERYTGASVLCAVIRYRPPTPEIPHNNWALVAMAEADTVRALVGRNGAARVAPPPGATDRDTAHVVTTIDPKKALASDGAFGGVFRRLYERSVGLSGKTASDSGAKRGGGAVSLLSKGEQLVRVFSRDGKVITKLDFMEKIVPGARAKPAAAPAPPPPPPATASLCV